VAITEALGALGNWSISLREDTPRELRDKIKYLGHITIHTGRVEPALVGDGLLGSSRFTGVLRGKSEHDEGFTLTGCGMEFWLGDEDDKGVVIENPLTLTGVTYTSAVQDLLDLGSAVVAGTLHPQVGTFTNTFQFMVLRKAIAYVASTGGHEYRVNGDATLDYGAVDELYVVTPKCFIVKRGSGVDMDLRALLGKSDVDSDVEDFTTRVVLLAASTETQVATGDADIAPGLNPYKDLHGNAVQLTRMVSESTTDATNADARAQLQLNRFSSTRDALTLSTPEYDINGSARIGDYVGVFNPDIGLYDPANEVPFRGGLLNPLNLRLIETTWPVSPGFMVAYRDPDGVWLDLTDYVVFEGGQTTVKVGGYNRSLTGAGSEPIGRLPQPDASVPDVVTWNEPFILSVYQSPTTGMARGEVLLDWNQPLNTDLTPIVDGSHYEIRYRRATVPAYPVTWGMVESEGLTWGDKETAGVPFNSPIQYPATEWQTAIAPFDDTMFRLQELAPAMPYEAQIRAVDLATPTNRGAWSDLTVWQTTNDDIPPVTPAPPFIVANPLAVQMTHELGAASGGTFNLDRDLHHLELHGGTEPLFTPSDVTLLGKAAANYGSIVGQIPVVQTFTLDNVNPVYFKVIAVDEAGNKSLPSSAVEMSMGLLDSQYITELTASKISAGTISTSILVGGRIATMPEFDFPGVEMTSQGLEGWDVSGFRSLFWDTTTGRLHVNGSGGIEIRDGNMTVKNAAGSTIVEVGECADGRHGVQVYDDVGVRVARMGELAAGGHGIEVISDTGVLVKVDTLAFGTKAATVSAAQTTTSSAYANLATVGPFVTVTLGNSARMIVIVSATINPTGVTGGTGLVGFDIAGPSGYFSAAVDLRALSLSVNNTFILNGSSKAFLVDGLPSAGSYTVQLKYRTAGATTSFYDRHVIVIPF
jgi:hypothetical protein